jgi:hypothetical protein
MAKSLLLLALAFLLLPGCASTSPEDAVPATSSTAPSFTVIADNKVDGPVTTDRYHFLALPEMTSRVPTATEPIRVPLQTLFERESSAGQNAKTWNIVLPQDVKGFVGNATLWAEIKGGSVVGNPCVTSNGCFWSLSVSAGPVQTGDYRDMGCVSAPLQVQPGVYRLEFAFAHRDVQWPAGTEMRFDFITNEQVQRSPGVTVELLTASVDYDSHIRVYGLELPLDPSLVLQTTA